MSSLKDRVKSLQADTTNTDTALTTLEEALAEKVSARSAGRAPEGSSYRCCCPCEGALPVPVSDPVPVPNPVPTPIPDSVPVPVSVPDPDPVHHVCARSRFHCRASARALRAVAAVGPLLARGSCRTRR